MSSRGHSQSSSRRDGFSSLNLKYLLLVLSDRGVLCVYNGGRTIDTIQNYVIVIATAFRHFEWGQYQLLRLRYIEIRW